MAPRAAVGAQRGRDGLPRAEAAWFSPRQRGDLGQHGIGRRGVARAVAADGDGRRAARLVLGRADLDAPAQHLDHQQAVGDVGGLVAAGRVAAPCAPCRNTAPGGCSRHTAPACRRCAPPAPRSRSARPGILAHRPVHALPDLVEQRVGRVDHWPAGGGPGVAPAWRRGRRGGRRFRRGRRAWRLTSWARGRCPAGGEAVPVARSIEVDLFRAQAAG